MSKLFRYVAVGVATEERDHKKYTLLRPIWFFSLSSTPISPQYLLRFDLGQTVCNFTLFKIILKEGTGTLDCTEFKLVSNFRQSFIVNIILYYGWSVFGAAFSNS